MNIKLTIKLKIQDVEHEFTVEELRELRDAIDSVLDDPVDTIGEPRTPAQEWADLRNQIRLSPLPKVPTDIEVTEAINNR